MQLRFLLILVFTGGFSMSLFAQPKLNPVLFASGFSDPVGIVNAGDVRLFIIQQRGLIRIVNLAGEVYENPFLDLSGAVSQSGFERGLLGLAFHPDFTDNGYFYVNYTRESDGSTVVSRFSVDAGNPDQANRESEVLILTVEQPFSNHNGGQLLFGHDGYLYIALGDGGNAGDPGNNAQNPKTFLGKMLRIDVNADDNSAYTIPPDNPFVGDENVLDEIWALGLRNPWRNSFDRYTGDFWIADVGQGQREEINFQMANSNGGENYGWRCYEGNLSFNSEGCAGEEHYVFPVFDYSHEGSGCSGSVTGGYVYRGAMYNGMYGIFIFADFCTGKLYQITPTQEGFEGLHAGNLKPTEISSFGEDTYGEIYLSMKNAGEIYRITETEDCNPVAIIMDVDTNLELASGTSIIIQAFFNPELDYQWNRNNEPLAGETQHELEITEEGDYQVHVKNPVTGCTNISEPVKVTALTTAAIRKELEHIKVYPNPAKDILHIDGLPRDGIIQVGLFDSKGIGVYSIKTITGNALTIHVGRIPSGLYHLRIISQTDVFQKKVLIKNSL
jgi:hypothetical protein